MNMADGVLLVVDSVEGPKPQTRFVLDKGNMIPSVVITLREIYFYASVYSIDYSSSKRIKSDRGSEQN
jgi:hypothetical protein